jgi:hypothetical protein
MPDSPLSMRRLIQRLRFRFTIRDLLVFTFGLAVGFAHSRVAGAQWSDCLLAIFFGWFIIGLAQLAWSSIKRWQQSASDLPLDVRCGLLLDALWPISIIAVVALALGMEDWWNSLSEEGRPEFSSWTLPAIIQSLLMLAVVCAYSRFPAANAEQSLGVGAKWQTLIGLVVACLAFFWVSLVVRGQILVGALVHVAIEGVYSFQPTRWAGQDFTSPRFFPELRAAFIHWGLVAGALCAAAFVLACFFITKKRTHWFLRQGMLVAWAVCITCACFHTHWAATVALPVLSPLLADEFSIPAAVYLLAFVLIAFAAAMLSWRITASVHEQSAFVPGTQGSTPVPLHRRIPVMGFFLLAALWRSLSIWTVQDFFWGTFGLFGRSSSFWSVQDVLRRISTITEVHLIDPPSMLRLAAIIVVAQQLWLTRRTGDRAPSASASVDPRRFVVGIVLLTIIGIVSTPAMAWYGVAFYFWSANK